MPKRTYSTEITQAITNELLTIANGSGTVIHGTYATLAAKYGRTKERVRQIAVYNGITNIPLSEEERKARQQAAHIEAQIIQEQRHKERNAKKHAEYLIIHELWQQGLVIHEIAKQLNYTPGSLYQRIIKSRKQYNLCPLRYTDSQSRSAILQARQRRNIPKKVYEYIQSFNTEHKRPPTKIDLCVHFNWSNTDTAANHIRILRKQGLLSKKSIATIEQDIDNNLGAGI